MSATTSKTWMPSAFASDPPALAPGRRVRVPDPPAGDITGVILAGGAGSRMGSQDKGLLLLRGRPLVAHVIEAIGPQVGSLLISANRNLDGYRAFGHPVLKDGVGQLCGPLAGIASAMQCAGSMYLLSAPCDAPLLPADLCARLYAALQVSRADIAVAHDGNRRQSLCALLRRDLLPDLLQYLGNGKRKVHGWYAEHQVALADFSDRTDSFLNINTRDDLRGCEEIVASSPERTEPRSERRDLSSG